LKTCLLIFIHQLGKGGVHNGTEAYVFEAHGFPFVGNFNKSKTTGATSGAGTAYPLDFSGFVLHNLWLFV